MIAFATTDHGRECILQDPLWISLTMYSAIHGSKNDFRYKTPPITADCLDLIIMTCAFFAFAGSVPSVGEAGGCDLIERVCFLVFASQSLLDGELFEATDESPGFFQTVLTASLAAQRYIISSSLGLGADLEEG
nr:hypothetical protein [Tanacetum cinerariifolium]